MQLFSNPQFVLDLHKNRLKGLLCKKNRKEYELKYLAILLNGHWFVGDELKLVKL